MKHATTVPMVIILAHYDVDVDEIPFLELLVAGNPVAHDMIYRDAGRTSRPAFRIPSIEQFGSLFGISGTRQQFSLDLGEIRSTARGSIRAFGP